MGIGVPWCLCTHPRANPCESSNAFSAGEARTMRQPKVRTVPAPTKRGARPWCGRAGTETGCRARPHRAALRTRACRRHGDRHCRRFGRMGRRGACDQTYPHASRRSSNVATFTVRTVPLGRAVRALERDSEGVVAESVCALPCGESGHWCRSMLLVRFAPAGCSNCWSTGRCNPGTDRRLRVVVCRLV